MQVFVLVLLFLSLIPMLSSCAEGSRVVITKQPESRLEADSRPEAPDISAKLDADDLKPLQRETNCVFNSHNGLVGFPTSITEIGSDGSQHLFATSNGWSHPMADKTTSHGISKALPEWLAVFERKLSDAFVPQAFGSIYANVVLSHGAVDSITFFGFHAGGMGQKDETSLEEPLKASVVAALRQASLDTADQFPDSEVKKLVVRLGFAGDPKGLRGYGLYE